MFYNALSRNVFPFLCWLLTLSFACSNPSSDKNQTSPAGRKDTLAQSPTSLTRAQYQNIQTHAMETSSIELLRRKVDSACQSFLDSDSISGIAMEYMDLRTGKGFTLFPNRRFIPASLLKIPILIAAFKLEEESPGSFSTLLPIYDIQEDIMDINLEENETYDYHGSNQLSLLNLVKIMVSHSDNRATLSVLKFLDQKSPGIVERVEKDLNASIPTDIDNQAEIVYIGHFADMLKALFNGSYLTEKHSQEALQLLSTSKYRQGFRKSIPGHIPMAQKFGVRFNATELHPEFPIQLHQVAIIYHPTNPFILSVMTKGAHIESLRAALQEIALICYTETDLLSKK